DHLGADPPRGGPGGVQPRPEDAAEAAVDPHEGALVVVQVPDDGALVEHAGADDDVQLVVDEPRAAEGRAGDLDPAQRVEEEVRARLEQPDEVVVAEVQADLVGADGDDLQHVDLPARARRFERRKTRRGDRSVGNPAGAGGSRGRAPWAGGARGPRLARPVPNGAAARPRGLGSASSPKLLGARRTSPAIPRRFARRRRCGSRRKTSSGYRFFNRIWGRSRTCNN